LRHADEHPAISRLRKRLSRLRGAFQSRLPSSPSILFRDRSTRERHGSRAVHGNLKLHPGSRCDALKRIDVHILRRRVDQLELRFCASGVIGDLRLLPPEQPRRADELWRHTCFEMLLRPSRSELYYEFNFSPSRKWAAYSFNGYRSGMQIFDAMRTPGIEVHGTENSCSLTAVLEPNCLNAAPGWRFGLSAVIEEMNGRMSYWALAHPPGKPDFHHDDCFALELPAPLPA